MKTEKRFQKYFANVLRLRAILHVTTPRTFSEMFHDIIRI